MIGLLLALAATAQSDWPTYHGGYSLDGVAPVAPPDAPVKLWSFRADHALEAPPIVGGGRIFAATTKGTLHALDLGGAEAWKVEFGRKVALAPPLYVGGRVYVGTSEGGLHALDAATGKEAWKYVIDDTIQGSPNLVALPDGKRGIVVIANGEGVVHCVSEMTGRLLWKTEPVERCDGSPGVGSGRVVMGSCASALHVISVAERGKSKDVELGGDSQVAGGVAVVGTTAYAGTRGGKLCAVDVVSGEVRWINGDNKAEAFTTPAVGESRVVFAAANGKVYGLNRADGKKLWMFEAGRDPGSPVIAGNRVVVGGDGHLYLLDLESGEAVWKTEISDRITAPAVFDGRILVGADDGTLVLFGKK